VLFRSGIQTNKSSEGRGFDHFYVQSPCNPPYEDYTEIFYTIYKWNISSIQCPAYNISARTAQKTPFLCRCFQLLPYEHACLRSRYSVTDVV
jgi:hypothetical protein